MRPRTTATAAKDALRASGNRLSEQRKRLTGLKNERQNLDSAVDQTIRTSHAIHGQKPAPVKRPQFRSFRQMSVVSFSTLQNCLWLRTWLLVRLGMLDCMRRPQTDVDSGAESGSICLELRRKVANLDVTAQEVRRDDALPCVAFGPSLASWQGTSNVRRTSQRSPGHFVGSINSVSGSPPAEFDLQTFQDLISSASDRHLANSTTLPRSYSERTSVIRLNEGESTNWLPDVDIYAIGSDEANLVNFVAKLDTGAGVCVMAEKVAARIGIDQIDKSDQPNIEGLADQGINPIGRIDIDFRLSTSRQWYRGCFYVISDSIIRDRFDALFSKEVIGQMKLLLLGPTLNVQTVQNVTSRCQECDHARITPMLASDAHANSR
jgi:hypothetical protein